jgi:DNA gyrase/topoisomerase IV subunit A
VTIVKRILVIVVALALAASLAGAQETAKNALVKRFDLTDRQADQLIAIYADSQQALRKAQAEVNVQKALLARLLLDTDANMREVEKVLRQAMEAELQIRMIQIQREMEARKLIGDRRWIRVRDAVMRLTAMKAARTAAQATGGDLSAEDQSLLQDLADLLGE